MPFSFGAGKGGIVDEYGNVHFEVKLFIAAGMLLSYPLVICVLFGFKPSVAYWLGNWTFRMAVFIMIWELVLFFTFVTKFIRKGAATIFMLILPAAVMAVACQLQEVNFKSISAMLISPDCHASPAKAQIQASWEAAGVFFDNCTKTLADGQGVSVEETRLVTPMYTCPGYQKEALKYGKDWVYIQGLEETYRCGGWCFPDKPLWYFSATAMDSCSLVSGRAMQRSISSLGMMVAVYACVVMLSVSCFLVMTDFSDTDTPAYKQPIKY
mmetsp:Transcript_100181/g.188771  ORF Transcript_100181/g.188771 Transcript_100181/m.188771 type:complete len:268 (+) Transcript_100181:147-950(+)